MKNEKLIFRIKTILAKNKSARDNMMLTVSILHLQEMNILKVKKQNYFDLLFSNKLSSIKTIDRLWRYVQEKTPHLRGKNWGKRQIEKNIVKQDFVQQKFSFND